MGSTLKGANSFLEELTPMEKGGQNENGRVASPKCVAIYLKQHILSLYTQSLDSKEYILRQVL